MPSAELTRAVLADAIPRDRARCQASLARFLESAWHVLLPASPYVGGWHVEEVARHLEAVARRECLELVVSQPPGTTKSLLACIAFPAWVWASRPEERFLLACYTDSLGREHNEKLIRLLESEWYRQRWGALLGGQPSTTMLRNLRGGFVRTTMPGGGSTGIHADIKLIDDPIKPVEATESPGATRQKSVAVSQWFKTTFGTRNADHRRATTVLIMQRLADDDLAGELIAKGYTNLRLPMWFEAFDPCTTPWGGDRRTTDLELLCPMRIDERSARELEANLGTFADAQLQQRPTPRAGGFFHRSWFRYYDDLPPGDSHRIQVWDTNFKGQHGSDNVVGMVWCVVRDRVSTPPRDCYYLIHAIEKKLDFPEVLDEIRALRTHWRALTVVIEDAANGPSIEQTMRKDIGGTIELVSTEGGKIGRANAIAKIFESGRVFFPRAAPWLGSLEEQLERFTRMKRDDFVDCTSHAVLYLHRKSSNYGAAMARLRGEQPRI